MHFAAFYGHQAVLEELLNRYPHLKEKREKVYTRKCKQMFFNGIVVQ